MGYVAAWHVLANSRHMQDIQLLAPILMQHELLCRIAKRRQQMSLPARRPLGYATAGKKDDKRTTLLAEDVAEALKEVSVPAVSVGEAVPQATCFECY